MSTTKDVTHYYCWKNNSKRVTLYGRNCRVLARGTKASVLIEFENGQKEVVSYRSLREIQERPKHPLFKFAEKKQ